MKLLDKLIFIENDEIHSGTLFVFGTRHHVSEFAHCIAKLWFDHALQHIVISGYGGEAEALAIAAYRLGVPVDAISLETEASNTYENVKNCTAILKHLCPEERLHVLTKSHAAFRCLLTLKSRFPGWQFAVHTVNYFAAAPDSWRQNSQFRWKIAEELERIIKYAQKGHLSLCDYPDVSEAYLQAASDQLKALAVEPQDAK